MSAVIEAGSAYTVAGIGADDSVSSVLVNDDLSSPASGQARVRFINASRSAGEVDIDVVEGPRLVRDAPFATVSEYGSVAAGVRTVEVTTEQTPIAAQMPLDLQAGSVNTLILLETDSPVGELTSVVDAAGMTMVGDTSAMAMISDAAGASALPALGGIQTGQGGTAPGAGGGPHLVWFASGALALVMASAPILVVRRRATVPA